MKLIVLAVMFLIAGDLHAAVLRVGIGTDGTNTTYTVQDRPFPHSEVESMLRKVASLDKEQTIYIFPSPLLSTEKTTEELVTLKKLGLHNVRLVMIRSPEASVMIPIDLEKMEISQELVLEGIPGTINEAEQAVPDYRRQSAAQSEP